MISLSAIAIAFVLWILVFAVRKHWIRVSTSHSEPDFVAELDEDYTRERNRQLLWDWDSRPPGDDHTGRRFDAVPWDSGPPDLPRAPGDSH